jgi:hypothetical protein
MGRLLDADNPYRQQWERYRELENQRTIAIVLFFVIGSFAVGPLIGWAERQGGGIESPLVPASVFLLMAPFGFFMGRISLWKCPRCRKRFLAKGPIPNLRGRRCIHCGLEKGAGLTAPSRSTAGR